MYIINPLANGKTEIQQDEFDKYFPHLKNGKTFYMEKRDEDFYIETTLMGDELISTVENAEATGKYKIKRMPPKENKNKEILINELLQKGSGFTHGKFRIYEYYTEDNKDFASFLKKEYGDGGGTIDNGGISYNAKGFRVKIERAELPEDNFDLTLGWANVANRIGQIIDRGEYFTEEEEEKYAIWKREKEELEEMKEIERWEREAKATARAQEQAKAEYTPEYQAYLKAQEKYPDAIVLQRVGDFYEVLGENAKNLAEEMDLTLVSREVSDKERQPMIGFPWYVEAQYLAKINENHTAVILDGEEERYLPKFDLDEEVEKTLDETSVEELEELLDIKEEETSRNVEKILDNSRQDETLAEEKARVWKKIEEKMAQEDKEIEEGYVEDELESIREIERWERTAKAVEREKLRNNSPKTEEELIEDGHEYARARVLEYNRPYVIITSSEYLAFKWGDVMPFSMANREFLRINDLAKGGDEGYTTTLDVYFPDGNGGVDEYNAVRYDIGKENGDLLAHINNVFESNIIRNNGQEDLFLQRAVALLEKDVDEHSYPFLSDIEEEKRTIEETTDKEMAILEREQKNAQQEYPKDFENPFTEALLDDMEDSKKKWVKIKVSHGALIKDMGKHLFMKMPSNSRYDGYTYNVFKNRVQESRQLVDLESDGRELCYEILFNKNETVVLRNRNGEVKLSVEDFKDIVDGTADKDYLIKDTAKAQNKQVKTVTPTVEIKNTKKGGQMDMNNQVKLQGRVKYNVELKKSSGGKDYVNVPVEVDRIQGDELKTDTFYISAFGQVAEDFAKFKKGDVVKIGGRLEQSTHDGKAKLGIIATNVSKAENDNASNIVTLSGFVNNKSLEIKQAESGKEYATIALGVKNYAGEYETYFVNAFGGTAKRAVAYKHRDLVSFEGFLQNTDGRLSVTAQRSEVLRTFDDKLKAEKEKTQENLREENEEEK